MGVCVGPAPVCLQLDNMELSTLCVRFQQEAAACMRCVSVCVGHVCASASGGVGVTRQGSLPSLTWRRKPKSDVQGGREGRGVSRVAEKRGRRGKALRSPAGDRVRSPWPPGQPVGGRAPG